MKVTQAIVCGVDSALPFIARQFGPYPVICPGISLDTAESTWITSRDGCLLPFALLHVSCIVKERVKKFSLGIHQKLCFEAPLIEFLLSILLPKHHRQLMFHIEGRNFGITINNIAI